MKGVVIATGKHDGVSHCGEPMSGMSLWEIKIKICLGMDIKLR